MRVPLEISRALNVLRAGGLVAMPTETVYGLAADAENELAVRKIFAVKGRPASHPLIVHVADAKAMVPWVREIPPLAHGLAEAFWPGPLTLVLYRTAKASDAVTGGQETVAMRVPRHPLALELLRELGGGVAAPSANRFGRISPTRAEHVREDLGTDVDFVLDGGPCDVGLESTIVDVTGPEPVLLRPGGVSREALEEVLKRTVLLHSAKTDPALSVRAPGLLPSHYAPRAGVLLADRGQVERCARERMAHGQRVAVLTDDASACPPGAHFVALPEASHTLAQRLYALMRETDAQGFDVMVILKPQSEGLGLAMRDRLERAAAPRDR